LTPNGISNPLLISKYLENVDVIVRQKIFNLDTTGMNDDPEFFGMSDRVDREGSISHKTMSQTPFDANPQSQTDLIGTPRKGVLTKAFMMKVKSNSEGLAVFRDLVIDIDAYEIEVRPRHYYAKYHELISLKQSIMDNDARLEINLKPKNVFQISINLQD